MAGRTGAADASGRYAGIVYLPGTAENGFQPAPPAGTSISSTSARRTTRPAPSRRAQALERWVAYARAHDAVILFDAAYEAYIRDPRCRTRSTRSRARARSRSSAAASRRRRASPGALRVHGRAEEAARADGRRQARSLNALWTRRVTIEVQRRRRTWSSGRPRRLHAGGPASRCGRRSTSTWTNARLIARGPGRRRAHGLRRAQRAVHLVAHAGRLVVVGLLRPAAREAQVVGTPGAGFGPSGEGYFRLTAFGSLARTSSRRSSGSRRASGDSQNSVARHVIASGATGRRLAAS